jgi:hypothetical protein
MLCASIFGGLVGIGAMGGVDAIDLSILAIRLVVHLLAHLLARFVHPLAELVDAGLATLLATLLQFLISGALHEDIDIALNLLGC